MRNQRRHELKIYRRRARRRTWEAQRNFLRNSIKKGVEKKNKRAQRKSLQLPIPAVFSLISNRNGVLNFFHSLNRINRNKTIFIFFDFSNVTELSHGALTIMLSMIGWLNDQGFVVSGNDPYDRVTRDQFHKSGFLEFMKRIGTRKFEKTDSAIVARGKQKTDSALTAKLIRKTTKCIWGVNENNKKLQGMLIELMANTINHAYTETMNQKGWYLAVDHLPKENKVKFCFVDNGQGILRTLRLKFGERIARLFGGTEETNIIIKAFEGEFGSRTRLSNRGRGLKAIKKAYELGHIKSLKIITNNIYYDLESSTSEKLNSNFNGTFYYWEIDNTCKR